MPAEERTESEPEPVAAEEVWGGPGYEPAPPEEPVAEVLRLAPEAAVAAAIPSSSPAPAGLSDEDVDRIARRVIELGGERIVRDIAWEVVPDLAEVLLKARIRELEASVE
jgi:hypothetical protein